MKKEDMDELVEWIKDSEDQNQFCEKSLLVDALIRLDQIPPDVEGARSRLIELTPLEGSKLVNAPSFAVQIENGEL